MLVYLKTEIRWQRTEAGTRGTMQKIIKTENVPIKLWLKDID